MQVGVDAIERRVMALATLLRRSSRSNQA